MIEARLERIEQWASIGAKSLLGIKETSAFTGLSVDRLYHLTSDRLIPHFKKNGRIWFDKNELEEWIREDRVLTLEEINRAATTHVATRKK